MKTWMMQDVRWCGIRLAERLKIERYLPKKRAPATL
jgi:hypothetical protein